MLDPRELREHAARCRGIASIRTVGGQAADRRLLELAARLEKLADRIEQVMKESELS
ncbi:MAG TPA: hypothetical protein VGL83_00880 [Stellaceae bacterium]|jgi:hypothetical protein